ncbi:MAG: glycosyltransferase family 4 protein [Fidelibacterota bacterium]
MKKVLFITDQYPPVATGGVFRSLYFTSNLENYGWKPTVLTNKSKLSWTYDPELFKKIPKNIDIIRANEWNTIYLHILLSKLKLNNLYNYIEKKLFIPDKKIGWLPTAVLKGKQLLESRDFDLIFSTSPSICSHLIAIKLSKHFRVPWICEFRDLWTMLPTYKFKGTGRAKIEKKMEYEFLKKARKVILVSHTFKTQFNRHYPSINPDKFKVIYNGFEVLKPIKKPVNNQQLTIIYTGSMYGSYYPAKLFDRLNDLIKKQPEISLKFIFVGKVEDKIKSALKAYKTIKSEFLGFRTKEELPRILAKADALLLFQMGNYISIPSKVFEYLAYQKPILAIVQDSELRNIASTTNIAYCASPAESNEIEDQFLILYKDWKHNSLPIATAIETLTPYSRSYQCHQLAKTFNEVT